MGYTRLDEEGREFAPPFEPALPRSKLGVLSVGIAIGVILLGQVVYPAFFPFLAVISRRSVYSYHIQLAFPTHRLLAGVLCVAGLGIGIAGLSQADRQKDLAVVGVILNALLIAGTGMSIAMPVLAEFFQRFL